MLKIVVIILVRIIKYDFFIILNVKYYLQLLFFSKCFHKLIEIYDFIYVVIFLVCIIKYVFLIILHVKYHLQLLFFTNCSHTLIEMLLLIFNVMYIGTSCHYS